jgi:hypothetical protein
MFNKIERYRKRYPKYKIVFLDPKMGLYRRKEQIETYGYRFAQDESECKKVMLGIEQADKGVWHVIYKDHDDIFLTVQCTNKKITSAILGNSQAMQDELRFKKKMGDSFNANFYAVCIKKDHASLPFVFISFLMKRIRRHARKLQPIF